MLYYTQLIFIKEGQEHVFHSFEDLVLPILERYNGVLIYRVRPQVTAVLATTVGNPYEVHLVSFPNREDFERYRDDPDRLRCVHLKDRSVERILLIEGKAL